MTGSGRLTYTVVVYTRPSHWVENGNSTARKSSGRTLGNLFVMASALQRLPRVASCHPLRVFSTLQTSSTPLAPPPIPVPIHNRPLLVSSSSPSFPKYLAPAEPSFPALVTPSAPFSSIAELGEAVDCHISSQLETHGALLFRLGSAINSPIEFNTLIESLSSSPMHYTGGSTVRTSVATNVLTASDDPPLVTIEPHNEMSYTADPPTRIAFYCMSTASHDGQTPIAKNEEILKNLITESPALVAKFRTKGVQYTRYLPDKSSGEFASWQTQFFTEDKATVESYAAAQNHAISFDSADNLTVTYTLPAFVNVNGSEVFCNQAHCVHSSYWQEHPAYEAAAATRPEHMYPTHTAFGDGERISGEEMAALRAATWRACRAVTWEAGDVLVLDNLRVQHGRIGFEGDRKVFASILK